MSSTTHVLEDLEAKAASGEPFSRAEAERVMATVDLVSVGVLGELSRRAHAGDVVTFGRVLVLAPGGATSAESAPTGAESLAGEIRVSAAPSTVDEAVEWVRQLRPSSSVYFTAFALSDVWRICDRDAIRLEEAARALRAAGLQGVSEVPLDAFETAAEAIAAIQALGRGGLGSLRATVRQVGPDGWLDLMCRAASIQAETTVFRAFAPLPRVEPAGEPSTGYDDVRAVAVARLVCATVPSVQVDWPLYGPKLAQVAIAFGADDIDGIEAVDRPDLGPRRAPVEEIARQIRAASAVPAERDGRFERRL